MSERWRRKPTSIPKSGITEDDELTGRENWGIFSIMDLGTKNESPTIMPATSSQTEESKINYPSFTIRDAKAKEFMDAHKCGMGDKFSGEVELVCTALNKDKYGSGCTFDVISLDVNSGPDSEESGEDEADEETDTETDTEKGMLGYTRPKAKKPSVDISAKSMSD
jgi:hypothetical protein